MSNTISDRIVARSVIDAARFIQLLNADGRVASNPFADWGWWYRIANVMLATAAQNVGVAWGSQVHGRLMAIFQDRFKLRYEEPQA
ncbi:TPA: hypothetical protein ACJ2XS_005911 [Pseudomonas aeruginosa]